MKLVQAGERTFYIEANTNIGIYKTGEHSVCLIDTGSVGDGEKIDRILCEQGWTLDYIINTHTHIDHLGGNAFLMEKYGVPAYCTDYDMAFAHFNELEAAYMNGGKPGRGLMRIFDHPGKIGFSAIEDYKLEGIEWTYLPGHTFCMIGVRTSDDVWFLADSYLKKSYLENHCFGYLYDAGGYMETLVKLQSFEGRLFVPAHGDAETDISEILELNILNQKRIWDKVLEICCEPLALDDILQKMYEFTGMKTNVVNHALLSSTTKGYLTYLEECGKIKCVFRDGKMTWRSER